MISDHRRRDNSDDDDTTFFLTVTSTYTLQSMPTNEEQLSSELVKSQSGSVSFTLTTEMVSTRDSSSSGTMPASSNTGSSSEKEAKNTSDGLGASSSKEDNSLVVGLAIGIPIAVIAVVVGVILLWYYVKKQKFERRRKQMFPYRNGKFYDDKQLPAKENIGRENNWSSNTIGLKHDEESRTYPRREVNQQGHSVRNFFNRLSRSVNLFSLNEVEADPSRANDRQNMNSPFYLKLFHLNNNATDTLDSEEEFASDKGNPSREEDEHEHGKTNKKKRCPKLPPLVDAYTSN